MKIMNMLENCWLIVATLSVLIVSLILGDSIMGITSAISGIMCVVLTARGKISAYYFGVVNCILYSIIAYQQTLYGETLLNTCYYLPLQFIGFKVWKKHLNETYTVKPISLSFNEKIILIAGIILGTLCLGLILQNYGDKIPFIDAFTTVASVIAMTLSAKRYSEQWYIWISINILSIYMWTNRYLSNGENIATLMMWIVFLLNSFYGLYKWQKK
jgi:nicotinamide mononucleotide transporter